MNNKVMELVVNQINGRESGLHNCHGYFKHEEKCKTNPKKIMTIDWVKVKIFVDSSGIVRDSYWECYGSPVTIASCSYLTDYFYGKLAQELIKNFPNLEVELDLASAKPQMKVGCSVAMKAFLEALQASSNELL
jgi:NifU-like protein involved in Fe-S cluster formation